MTSLEEGVIFEFLLFVHIRKSLSEFKFLIQVRYTHTQTQTDRQSLIKKVGGGGLKSPTTTTTTTAIANLLMLQMSFLKVCLL